MLHAKTHLRFALLALFPVVLLVGPGNCVFAQESAAGAPISRMSARPTTFKPSVEILFTARLLGYARVPDKQDGSRSALQGCPPVRNKDKTAAAGPSIDASALLASIQKSTNTVLVGIGENFSPELSSRIFNPAPETPENLNAYLYGKDLYEWDPTPVENSKDKPRWVLANNVSKPTAEKIIEGRSTIPTDNVGCFFRTAGYDAIVPGKHDFYFGPERLRQIARFLATKVDGAEAAPTVQMLAANLVIRSSYANPHKVLADVNRSEMYTISEKDIKPTSFVDRRPMLPWVRHFKFSSEKEVRPLLAHVCRAKDDNPAARVETDIKNCQGLSATPEKLKRDDVRIGGKEEYKYDFRLPPEFRLEPGKNYMLCMKWASKEIPDHDYCVRFAVDFPFFLYPHIWPQEMKRKEDRKEKDPDYTDPAPYVFKKLTDPKDDKKVSEVAIFGVVDPDLKQHIGQLNYAWRNDRDKGKYKTEIDVMDPASALSQTLELFEEQHAGFVGVKILLAQMTPAKAQQLAARMADRFNVVITEPQYERVTPNGEAKFSTPAPDTKLPKPTFVVVPPPYFNPVKMMPVLDLRKLVVQEDSGLWTFTLSGMGAAAEQPQYAYRVIDQPWFNEQISEALKNLIKQVVLPNELADPRKAFSQFTLRVLKETGHADIALLQARDIYFEARMTPEEAEAGQKAFDHSHPGTDQERMQSMLLAIDRLLWKGDFIIKRSVPGSALKAVLKHSDEFETQDNASLSLETEKGRSLEKIGIIRDAEREEYLINGEPLDDGRLYAVATTDYIGLGDTGYPELLAATVGGPVGPRDLHYLCPLRVAVHHATEADDGGYYDSACDKILTAKGYFDETDQKPSDLQAQSYWNRVENWLHLKTAKHLKGTKSSDPWSKDTMGRLERDSQLRPIWFVSLEKGTASLSAVRNNIDEATRSADFTGVTLPQVQARKSSNIKFESKAHAGSSGSRIEWFVGYDLAHARTGTAQKSAPAQFNFVDNRLNQEAGLFFHTPWRKKYPRLGPEMTIRDETQLFAPLENFTLADANKSNLAIEHKRTHSVVLPRLGLRLQDRESNMHWGFEYARVDRIDSYIFRDPNGSVTTCNVDPRIPTSVSGCVAANSSGSSPAITTKSTADITTTAVYRKGFYFTGKLVVPSYSKVSFVSEHDFELFLPEIDDRPNMTYWRYLWTNSVRFKIFDNFSASPKVEIFYFQNQAGPNPANQHFFRQLKYSIDLNYAFEWFRGNPGGALRYQRPPAK